MKITSPGWVWNGVLSPRQQLVLIRSWQTSTLLVKNGIFTEQELTTLQQFCIDRAFDLAYTPKLSIEQANRFNVLSEPVFYLAISAMLSDEREQFLARYKFNLQPATDNRPYFHHFFKWSAFGEIYQLRRQGGMPLIEWGYIIPYAITGILNEHPKTGMALRNSENKENYRDFYNSFAASDW